MSFEDIVRKQISATPFSDKLTRSVLKVLLGEIQQKTAKSPKFTDEMAHNIIKGFIKSNEDNVGYLEPDDARAEVFRKENEVLRALLPQYWSADQIRGELTKIEASLKEKGGGAAIGLAMKHLKEAKAPVEGDMVKKVVSDLLGIDEEEARRASLAMAKMLGF